MAELPLKHWLKSKDENRFTSLTEDNYWFCIKWIGDGWAWSVYKIVDGQGSSVSPTNRIIHKDITQTIGNARSWYISRQIEDKAQEISAILDRVYVAK